MTDHSSNQGLITLYEQIKKCSKKGYYSCEMTSLIDQIYKCSMSILSNWSKENLLSKVEQKSYFAYFQNGSFSRAINSSLFNPNFEKWEKLRDAMRDGCLDKTFNPYLITEIIYSIAISFCACIDIIKRRDQKTPGTFFEYLIAYFFTWRVGVEPQNSIPILNIDEEEKYLPTDFVYNLGKKARKFHMPIKTSSRERAIMIWAHQKLLDGVYGVERFMGTPVLLAETKVDAQKKEVVEICLPDQWRLYQLYIAKLKRIYYLDIPRAYQDLNNEFPPIIVKTFGHFFYEWDTLTPS